MNDTFINYLKLPGRTNSFCSKPAPFQPPLHAHITYSIFATASGGTGERWLVDHLLYPRVKQMLGTLTELRPNFSPTDTHSLDGDMNNQLIMTTQVKCYKNAPYKDVGTEREKPSSAQDQRNGP